MRRWGMNESDQGPVYLGYRLGHIKSDGRIFRALVYNEGAAVLHMLRRLIGDDAFFKGLRRFYASARFRKDNPELYGAFLDAVKEATSIIAADPKGTAQSWINDSNSKLPLEMVTKVVTAANVEWTMTPAATMKFAKFMRRVGTIKHEPVSWKDLFFPEIGGLNGS